MEQDENDIERQNTLKGLWNDAKRYQEVRHEVRNALEHSREESPIIPFYRQRYFAIAASITILIGISITLLFIIQKPFTNSGEDNLTQGNDTTLKLQMDKPDAKARQEIYRNDILLQWRNHYDTISHLVIISFPEGLTVFKTEIKPFQHSYQLRGDTLMPGKYEWYIGEKKFKKILVIDH